jgi:S-adenosylmethionine decarboxylase
MAFPDICTDEVFLRIAESSGSLAELNDPIVEDVSDEEINPLETGPHDFEGPEKTMEVCFEPGIGNENGLRDLTRQQLDHLCTQAKCTILSHISSNHLDAYVLSESSLFVYKHRWIMKTCGTTTLLCCLNSLLEYADALGMTIRWVGYSRKNLNNPSAQSWPHSNFGDEIAFLNSQKTLQERLNGVGHILGPVTGDHWFVYVADLPRFSCVSLPPLPSEITLPYGTIQLPAMSTTLADKAVVADSISSLEGITLNLMMFDLDLEVAKIFYKREGCQTGEEMTIAAGIHHIVPGATIDAAAFTPCGYSMNSILHDSYSTIHITPEPQCSYASFETNTSLPSYLPLVRNVLNVFGPKRFILTLFADESALKNLHEPPAVAFQRILVPRFGTYSRTSVSSTTVEGNVSCIMICLSMDELRTSPNGKAPSPINDSLLLRQRTRTE